MFGASVLKQTVRCLSPTAKLSPFSAMTTSACSIHTSQSSRYPGKDWRKARGKPLNPNSYGPLTDGPDFSYLDGRPTPAGYGKIRRATEQKEIAGKILQLNAEMEFAVTNHSERVKAENERRSEIVRMKLKPKGGIPPEAK